ncbi:MAG: CCA tRNA nucleotidyltransferase [Holosporaceae bacterium]|jgi:tRNA nucleotidyltransferase/poly(A) polymerase|nr:CCA tRNA nucleotidyltransferase [Holosporaceae bacterium]
MGHKKNNSLIDENIFFILDLIEKCGFRARIVGGAVRDFLLKKKISDVDLATDAHPAEIIDICRRHGVAVVPVGIKYGSVTAIYDHNSYEITTLRRDIKTFGRHSEVEFSQSFKTDARRRDFTINAIYMDKDGRIYDYHSGIEDIRSRNIRFIGDARKRITEDYLRIFRYFRFVAACGNYKYNQEYLEVISQLKSNVKLLSSERIVTELIKILDVPHSNRIIPQMMEILNELFALQFNSLDVCVKLGIFKSLSSVERLAMLLKFSNFSDLTRMYNFPKNISEMILLKSVDYQQIFMQLKQIKKDYRIFYAKFWAVNSYLNASGEDVKKVLKKLLNFCRSEQVDFKLTSCDLKKYHPTREELKHVMQSTKKFWINNNVSPNECKKYAVACLESCREPLISLKKQKTLV